MNPIIFIIIGAVVFVVILIVVLIFCCKKSAAEPKAKKSQIEITSAPVKKPEPEKVPSFYE